MAFLPIENYSPMASPLASSKVCTVLYCPSDKDYHHIYIVDFSRKESGVAEGHKYRHPNICVPISFGLKCLCLFGSKLFMFALTDIENTYEGRRVVTYDIPDTPVYNVILKEENVVEAPPLNHSKMVPVGIPTPDGRKLLVFSTAISWDDLGNCHDFELYDPDIGSWQSLPGIRGGRRYATIFVNAYCIIENALVLHTDSSVFVLDMEFPNQTVKKMPLGIGMKIPPKPDYGYGYFVAISTHDLYLMPVKAQDIVRGIVMDYPGSCPWEDYSYRPSRSITLTQKYNNRFIEFCISHVGFRSRKSLHPHLVVCLYRLDLDEYTKEMNKEKKEQRRHRSGIMLMPDIMLMPGTTLMKSFDFRLEALPVRKQFRSLGVYALP